jgi:hypothetical protein
VDTSDLHVPLVGNFLESLFVSRKLWQLDVHGSSQSSSQVSWARSDVTQVVVMSELGYSFDVVGSVGKSSEDFSDSRSLLHGDDSELVLFVDPDEESFGIIVENTSSRWPVSVESASF